MWEESLRQCKGVFSVGRRTMRICHWSRSRRHEEAHRKRVVQHITLHIRLTQEWKPEGPGVQPAETAKNNRNATRGVDTVKLYQFCCVYRHFILNKCTTVRDRFDRRCAESHYLGTVVLFDISKDP